MLTYADELLGLGLAESLPDDSKAHTLYIDVFNKGRLMNGHAVELMLQRHGLRQDHLEVIQP